MGRLSTVDLLVRIACFVKKVSHVLNIKRSWSKPVTNTLAYYLTKLTKKNSNCGWRLITVDLLVRIACFVKTLSHVYNAKRSWSKPVTNTLAYYYTKLTERNSNCGGRLSTVDLLVRIACFVKTLSNIFNVKRRWSKLVFQMKSEIVCHCCRLQNNSWDRGVPWQSAEWHLV